MHRFYVAIDFEVESCYSLPIDVVRHINVLRIRNNEDIELFNGDGFNYRARLSYLEKREAQVIIQDKYLASNESSLKIILLMALIANDKFDLVVQKAVELGVQEIIPIITKNTQRNFNQDKIDSKLSHWQKIIISATEQSCRAQLMHISHPVELVDAIAEVQKIQHKYILSPHHMGVIDNTSAVTELAICIGPEGGLTNQEVEFANANRFNSVVLGKRIMRAETAALSSVSVFQNLFGDF